MSKRKLDDTVPDDIPSVSVPAATTANETDAWKTLDPRAPASAETLVAIVRGFCARAPLSDTEKPSALYKVLLASRDAKLVLPTDLVNSIIATCEPHRLVVLVLALRWTGFSDAARIERLVGSSARSTSVIKKLLSANDSLQHAQFWAALYASNKADEAWTKLCRTKRGPFSALGDASPPTDIALPALLPADRDELVAHVASLATLALGGTSADVRLAWEWIDHFWHLGLDEDRDGAISLLATTHGTTAEVEKIVERGLFGPFMVRLALDAIWQKVAAKDAAATGQVAMIAAGLKSGKVSRATFRGHVGVLLRMALSRQDDALFDALLDSAPDLGAVTDVADIVRTLVEAKTVARFERFAALPTVNAGVVWQTFVGLADDKQDHSIAMFQALLRCQRTWSNANRAYIVELLEKRKLLGFLCEFTEFTQDTSKDPAALKATLKAFKRLAKSAPQEAADECQLCQKPANAVLLCGHRNACVDCIVPLIDRFKVCPRCRAVVDRTKEHWYIQVY